MSQVVNLEFTFLLERDKTDKVEVETTAAVPGKLFLANK